MADEQLPGTLTTSALHEVVEELLRTVNWDSLTLSVIIASVETRTDVSPGALQPFKKIVKATVDAIMRCMLAKSADGCPKAASAPAGEPCDDLTPASISANSASEMQQEETAAAPTEPPRPIAGSPPPPLAAQQLGCTERGSHFASGITTRPSKRPAEAPVRFRAPSPAQLESGDRVSVVTRCWGDAWAKHVHAADGSNARNWRSGRTYGTVIAKQRGGKVVCDFGETDSPHAAWDIKALRLESRPEGRALQTTQEVEPAGSRQLAAPRTASLTSIGTGSGAGAGAGTSSGADGGSSKRRTAIDRDRHRKPQEIGKAQARGASVELLVDSRHTSASAHEDSNSVPRASSSATSVLSGSGGNEGRASNSDASGRAASNDAQEQRQGMSEEVAERIAALEGLQLLRRSMPGMQSPPFQNVCEVRGRHCAYIQRGGLMLPLGSFDSAAEAALAYARALGREYFDAAATAAAAAANVSVSPMSDADAKRLAYTEGLQLVPNASGRPGEFHCVHLKSLAQLQRRHLDPKKPFEARTSTTGGHSLGFYSSGVEAALAYARNLGRAYFDERAAAERACAAAAAAPAAHMSEEEAERLAEAEGLELERRYATGVSFANVTDLRDGSSKPFQVMVGKSTRNRLTHDAYSLGCYSTAAEGALAYARHLGPAHFAALAAEAVSTTAACHCSLGAAEAHRLATMEGLKLVTSHLNSSGFRGVSEVNSRDELQRFLAISREGKSLGTFQTAAAAALAYARNLGPVASVNAAAASEAVQAYSALEELIQGQMNEAEVEQQADLEGLQLLRSERRISGFSGVRTCFNGGPYGTVSYEIDAEARKFPTAHEAALAYSRHLGTQHFAMLKAAATASSLDARIVKLELGSDSRVDVETLLAVRTTDSGRQFLIRWFGRSADDDSWEDESSISDQLTREFDSKRRIKRAKTSCEGGKSSAVHITNTRHLFPVVRQSSDGPSTTQQRIGPEYQVQELPACAPRASSRATDASQQISHAVLLKEAADCTGALLTAAAFGPLGDFCFVSSCDCGLGLFARGALQPGQFICE